jgi:hypothetical protein
MHASRKEVLKLVATIKQLVIGSSNVVVAGHQKRGQRCIVQCKASSLVPPSKLLEFCMVFSNIQNKARTSFDDFIHGPAWFDR